MWQQLELASKLESDLQDTVEWGRKWLVDFNTRKTQAVSELPHPKIVQNHHIPKLYKIKA